MNSQPAAITELWWARLYLIAQACAAVVWWVSVFASSNVKEWTLGGWNAAALALPDLILFAGASALVAWRRPRPAILVLVTWTTVITFALATYALIEQRAGWGAFIMVIALAGTAASALTAWHGHLPVSWFFLGPFRFSEATANRSSRHLRNSVVQLIIFWTFFLVFVPFVLSRTEERIAIDWAALDRAVFDAVGIGVFLVASSLGIWSCFTMALRGDGTPLPAATASKLVISGPYTFVRNPMAVAGALQTIGVGLWMGSWTAMLSALAGAALWNVAIRPSEEHDLHVRFGDDYVNYCDQVGCWRPSFTSFDSR